MQVPAYRGSAALTYVSFPLSCVSQEKAMVCFFFVHFPTLQFILSVSPKSEGSSSLSQLLTLPCSAITKSMLQVIMGGSGGRAGRRSWHMKEDISNKGHRRTSLYMACDQDALYSDGCHLPFISHCQCRDRSSSFLAVTSTRVFNSTLSHLACQVITIIFLQILCKELQYVIYN